MKLNPIIIRLEKNALTLLLDSKKNTGKKRILFVGTLNEQLEFVLLLSEEQRTKPISSRRQRSTIGKFKSIDHTQKTTMHPLNYFLSQCFFQPKLNLIQAKYYLKFILVYKTANDLPYKRLVVLFCSIFLVTLYYFPIFFHVVNIFCFLLQNSLKFLLFTSALVHNNTKFVETFNNVLPIYSILVPLYREAEKLEDIICSITSLNYDHNKLDIKLIIEEDDAPTIAKLNELRLSNKLPQIFQIIYVPCCLPKTKPKALNFALPYCLGEYVVVYDAEDIPEPNQLLMSLEMFKTLPEEYACLQAKLNFYNANENLLTKFFSYEYGIWFDYLLRGLCTLELPIPLGGTSNHFKKRVLEKIGMWDACNVAEDADLGVRLYLFGFKTFILDSYTLEEAPNNINIWLAQRARWIKGYIQTFMIFLINKPNRFKLSPLATTTIYILLGISSYSFFIFPWVLIKIFINTNWWINLLWLTNSFFCFSYVYSSLTYYIYKKKPRTALLPSLNRTESFTIKLLTITALLLFPGYYLLHVLASYRAIWEIVFAPFKWNKTLHGISKHKK